MVECWSCGGPHHEDLCPRRVVLPPQQAVIRPSDAEDAGDALMVDPWELRSRRIAREPRPLLLSDREEASESSQLMFSTSVTAQTPALSSQLAPRRDGARGQRRVHEQRLSAFHAAVRASVDLPAIIRAAALHALSDLAALPQVRRAAGMAAAAAAIWAWGHPSMAALLLVAAGGVLVAAGRGHARNAQEWAVEAVLNALTRGKDVDLNSLRATRRAAMALAAAPTLLSVAGMVTLMDTIGLIGSATTAAAVSAAMTLAALAYCVAACAAARRSNAPPGPHSLYMRILKLSWYAILLISALIALVLGHGHLHAWDWAIARRFAVSALLTGAHHALAALPQGAATGAARRGLARALDDAFTGVREQLTADALLQLALVRWLVDFWAAPEEFSWDDMRAMLGQAVDTVRMEVVDSRLLPAVEATWQRLDQLDVDTQAQPAADAVDAALGALPPTRCAARALLALFAGPCACALAAVLLLPPHRRAALAALPLLLPALLEARSVRRALRAGGGAAAADLSSGGSGSSGGSSGGGGAGVSTGAAAPQPGQRRGGGGDDGLALLLGECSAPLARVWANAGRAAAMMHGGVRALRAAQATTRAARLVFKMTTLATLLSQGGPSAPGSSSGGGGASNEALVTWALHESAALWRAFQAYNSAAADDTASTTVLALRGGGGGGGGGDIASDSLLLSMYTDARGLARSVGGHEGVRAAAAAAAAAAAPVTAAAAAAAAPVAAAAAGALAWSQQLVQRRLGRAAPAAESSAAADADALSRDATADVARAAGATMAAAPRAASAAAASSAADGSADRAAPSDAGTRDAAGSQAGMNRGSQAAPVTAQSSAAAAQASERRSDAWSAASAAVDGAWHAAWGLADTAAGWLHGALVKRRQRAAAAPAAASAGAAADISGSSSIVSAALATADAQPAAAGAVDATADAAVQRAAPALDDSAPQQRQQVSQQPPPFLPVQQQPQAAESAESLQLLESAPFLEPARVEVHSDALAAATGELQAPAAGAQQHVQSGEPAAAEAAVEAAAYAVSAAAEAAAAAVSRAPAAEMEALAVPQQTLDTATAESLPVMAKPLHPLSALQTSAVPPPAAAVWGIMEASHGVEDEPYDVAAANVLLALPSAPPPPEAGAGMLATAGIDAASIATAAEALPAQPPHEVPTTADSSVADRVSSEMAALLGAAAASTAAAVATDAVAAAPVVAALQTSTQPTTEHSDSSDSFALPSSGMPREVLLACVSQGEPLNAVSAPADPALLQPPPPPLSPQQWQNDTANAAEAGAAVMTPPAGAVGDAEAADGALLPALSTAPTGADEMATASPAPPLAAAVIAADAAAAAAGDPAGEDRANAAAATAVDDERPVQSLSAASSCDSVWESVAARSSDGAGSPPLLVSPLPLTPRQAPATAASDSPVGVATVAAAAAAGNDADGFVAVASPVEQGDAAYVLLPPVATAAVASVAAGEEQRGAHGAVDHGGGGSGTGSGSDGAAAAVSSRPNDGSEDHRHSVLHAAQSLVGGAVNTIGGAANIVGASLGALFGGRGSGGGSAGGSGGASADRGVALERATDERLLQSGGAPVAAIAVSGVDAVSESNAAAAAADAARSTTTAGAAAAAVAANEARSGRTADGSAVLPSEGGDCVRTADGSAVAVAAKDEGGGVAALVWGAAGAVAVGASAWLAMQSSGGGAAAQRRRRQQQGP